MIRVPSIAINRPWASPRSRKQTSSPAEHQSNLEKELGQQRLHAKVEREKAEVFASALLNGRPLF